LQEAFLIHDVLLALLTVSRKLMLRYDSREG